MVVDAVVPDGDDAVPEVLDGDDVPPVRSCGGGGAVVGTGVVVFDAKITPNHHRRKSINPLEIRYYFLIFSSKD